jgi:hypothetical protein
MLRPVPARLPVASSYDPTYTTAANKVLSAHYEYCPPRRTVDGHPGAAVWIPWTPHKAHAVAMLEHARLEPLFMKKALKDFIKLVVPNAPQDFDGIFDERNATLTSYIAKHCWALKEEPFSSTELALRRFDKGSNVGREAGRLSKKVYPLMQAVGLWSVERGPSRYYVSAGLTLSAFMDLVYMPMKSDHFLAMYNNHYGALKKTRTRPMLAARLPVASSYDPTYTTAAKEVLSTRYEYRPRPRANDPHPRLVAWSPWTPHKSHAAAMLEHARLEQLIMGQPLEDFIRLVVPDAPANIDKIFDERNVTLTSYVAKHCWAENGGPLSSSDLTRCRFNEKQGANFGRELSRLSKKLYPIMESVGLWSVEKLPGPTPSYRVSAGSTLSAFMDLVYMPMKSDHFMKMYDVHYINLKNTGTSGSNAANERSSR